MKKIPMATLEGMLNAALESANPEQAFARMQQERHIREIKIWLARFQRYQVTIQYGKVNAKTGEATDLENVHMDSISVSWDGNQPRYEVMATDRAGEVYLCEMSKLSKIKIQNIRW